MKLNCLLIVFLLLYSASASAAFIPSDSLSVAGSAGAMAAHQPELKKLAKKPTFFQRIALRIALKRYSKHHKRVDIEKADQLASTALTLGIVALACALIPFYTILAAIPLGIIAMSTGRTALKNNTTKESNARLGKSFGLAALIVAGLWIFLGAIALVVLLSSWN